MNSETYHVPSTMSGTVLSNLHVNPLNPTNGSKVSTFIPILQGKKLTYWVTCPRTYYK